MTKTFLAGLAVLCAACGSGDDDGGGAITCAPEERTGTYRLRYTTLDGNCGDVPESIGRLDNAAAELGDGCTFDAEDRWTENDCKLERAFTCPAESIGPGMKTRTVAVSTQEDDSGAHLTGTTTVTVLQANGQVACVGTYELNATRL